ncbi:Na+/H+ antiporter NhaC [Bacillus sp. mrc49]|uniref:Na+/H+ antiporter NhaC n=1 Tax=Bacillus sp. mrc49 TaxID=2054913 RepID=UPI000C276A7C|nr:Na+/H+ antiporter NhaC [Bacillus sp. mrc49]PJN86926.1 Na+/H+ antiporter NhaC [Bacillus sp. mrc49]
MRLDDAKLKLSLPEAICVLAMLFLIIAIGIIHYELVPHIPIIAAILFLFIYGKIKKLPFSIMEAAIVKGAVSGMGAIYIFFFIGMLISIWMASGTIPTIMFYGFDWMSGKYFYAVTFLVCSLIGLCIGSSLTTSATIGVAFIGMASALDLSLAITAGAIISGAFLGDKMSPLSDSTNLASGTVGVPLFEHINNMQWTTIPGFLLSLIFFYFLSPNVKLSRVEEIEAMTKALEMETNISIWSLIPFVIILVMALKKVSAIPTLSAGIVSAAVIAFIQTPSMTVAKMADILYGGFVLKSGMAQLDTILSRGGIESMMFSVSMVLLALAMGGLLFELGVIPSILHAVQDSLTSVARLISATVFAGISVNFLVGEQYLSVILPGKAFQQKYEELGLQPKTLGRVLEDAGTVVNPLVPWGVCGVFLTKVLGVPTLEYAPFAFFCLICPLLSLISGFTKVGIHYK